MQAFHWNLSQAHRPTSPRGPDTRLRSLPYSHLSQRTQSSERFRDPWAFCPVPSSYWTVLIKPPACSRPLRPRLRWKVPVSIQRLGTWMSCGLPPTDSGGWGRSAWVWDEDLSHSILSPSQRCSSLCHMTNRTVMLLFLHQDSAES